MINEESPYTCLKKAGGTVSCSHQQLSHASDSQGPQTPSGALIHSVRRSSPGLSWSHWGSHSSDPHPFRQGVLTWPLLVSPGVSQLGPLSVLLSLPGLTGGLTSWLVVLPEALHQTGRDEGGSTVDPTGLPGSRTPR